MTCRSNYCLLLIAFWVSLAMVGCSQTTVVVPVEIIYRDWAGAMPQSVLDAFTKETGIKVVYQPYENQESLLQEIRSGQRFDVIVLESELIPGALRENLLAELDIESLTNYKNISPNFRDLVYDPYNAHSIPYSWGTTGLVVRSDLVSKPVTKWADLWDPQFAGKIITWNSPRYMIGIALKSLNYSINSESPQELESAKQKLISLKPHTRQVNWEMAVAMPFFLREEAVLAIGQIDELMAGQKANVPISYILPDEGAILWGDNWAVPTNAPNKEAGEKLINFFLRSDIGAEIINTTFYWLPNEAALPLVNPELRNNPNILPDPATLKNAEILSGLSPEGEKLYQMIWDQVQAGEK